MLRVTMTKLLVTQYRHTEPLGLPPFDTLNETVFVFATYQPTQTFSTQLFHNNFLARISTQNFGGFSVRGKYVYHCLYYNRFSIVGF